MSLSPPSVTAIDLARPCGSVLYPSEITSDVEALREVLGVAGTDTRAFDILTEEAIKDAHGAIKKHALEMVNGADCNATGTPTSQHLIAMFQGLIKQRQEGGSAFKAAYAEKHASNIRESMAWLQQAEMRYEMEGQDLAEAKQLAEHLLGNLDLMLNLADNPDSAIPAELAAEYGKADDDEGNDEGNGGACPF